MKILILQHLWLVLIGTVLVAGGLGLGIAWKAGYLEKFTGTGKPQSPEEPPPPPPQEPPPSVEYEEKLAFLKDGQVWLAEKDGSSPRQLTSVAEGIMEFHFSPDGKKLAYILQKEILAPADPDNPYSQPHTFQVGYKLAERDLANGQERVLVESLDEKVIEDFVLETWDASAVGLNGFSYSPDGKFLAYTRLGVWLKDLETGAVKPLSEELKIEDVRFYLGRLAYLDIKAWSPSMDKLLVEEGFIEGLGEGVFDGTNLNGVTVSTRGLGGGSSAHTFWDEENLLMDDYREDESTYELENGEIYVAPIVERVYETPSEDKKTLIYQDKAVFSNVVLAKTSGKIFFSVNDAVAGSSELKDNEIYSLSLDGSGLQKITNINAPPVTSYGQTYTIVRIFDLATSSDGKFLTFRFLRNYDPSGSGESVPDEILLLNVETGELTKVAEGRIEQVEWAKFAK